VQVIKTELKIDNIPESIRLPFERFDFVYNSRNGPTADLVRKIVKNTLSMFDASHGHCYQLLNA
jgi:hypothetical protein